MAHQYKPRGVCSRRIAFDLTDGVVRNVSFEGGCSGNTQGISRLVEGLSAEEGNARRGGDPAARRHTLRLQVHLLPGSVGHRPANGLEGGGRPLIPAAASPIDDFQKRRRFYAL